MCGIVGSFRNDGLTHAEIKATKDLTEMMRRRGPDDAGFWNDQYCAFGFRRLSILDLTSAGNQPMKTRDQRYVLLYNGEVYNFAELRTELESAGIQFQSTGDTEVVLYSLAVWGIQALKRFNGMFALAFYDSKDRTLTLARDHAGMKPIYYIRASQGIAFASQYDQIRAHPWAQSLNVSNDSLALYLRFGYIPAPYALLKNTFLLEAGSWLQINRHGIISQGKFFEFSMFSEPDLKGNDAWDAVDSAVTNAVRRHVISDVPVGAFLSGGVDSPLIVAKMRELIGPFPTFTMGIDDPERDESHAATAYATELELENTLVRMNPAMALQMLDDMSSACGEPFGDYSILPALLISSLAKQKVKVLLSGDGGDELFWGYWLRFSTILDGLPLFEKPYWRRQYAYLYRAFIQEGHRTPPWRTIGDWYRKIHQRIPERWFGKIFSGLSYPSDFHLFQFSETNNDKDRAAQWMRWNEFRGFLSMVLMKVDRGSMHHSLEVRVPLLDREVVDVAMRINWDSCMDMERKVGKLPLRHSLARSLPTQTEKKRGFTIPLNNWFRTSFKQLFEETVLTRKSVLGIEWNQQAITAYFNSHLTGHEDNAWGLWVLLSIALWEDRYARKTG
jgi:asparagine synthase (glutamine-hydrolysing)